MLIARGCTSLGQGRLRFVLALAARIRATVVSREGMVLDTRFAPATEGANPGVCLYLLLRGTWQVLEPVPGPRFDGPCAFVLTEEHLDGADGSHSVHYRAAGSPCELIEIHLAAADLAYASTVDPLPVEIDASSWRAARCAIERMDSDDATLSEALGALYASLATAGLIETAAVDGARRPLPAPFPQLWRALRPMVERLYLNPTLQEVSAATGISSRQVDRHIKYFVTAFGLFGDGWRPATRHLRLKLALLLLSVDGASIAEVARVVGYGGTVAMARAFRDAKLLPPGEIQAKLRAK